HRALRAEGRHRHRHRHDAALHGGVPRRLDAPPHRLDDAGPARRPRRRPLPDPLTFFLFLRDSAMTFAPRLPLLALLVAALAVLPACEGTGNPPVPDAAPAVPAPLAEDVHSFARPDVARVRHVDLDLAADFDARRLSGTATLTVEATPGAREIVLDVRGLTIHGVADAQGRPLDYRLGDADPVRGRPLTVALPAEGSRIAIRYETSPDAAALQWLTPQMTAGGEHPFLFTQGQAILTRTWIPTQDSPGIRQ